MQNEFLCFRFNQLPENDITNFLSYISKNESLSINPKQINLIQQLYKSDIRSMINFIQTNQNLLTEEKLNIINNDIWKELNIKFINKDKADEAIINFFIIIFSILVNSLVRLLSLFFSNKLRAIYK